MCFLDLLYAKGSKKFQIAKILIKLIHNYLIFRRKYFWLFCFVSKPGISGKISGKQGHFGFSFFSVLHTVLIFGVSRCSLVLYIYIYILYIIIIFFKASFIK